MSDAAERPRLERVLVVGTSGSGKTTFARSLAERLGVPHVEIDAIHWLPDWVARERKDFRARVAGLVAQPGWVMDGNFGSVRDLTWPRATAVLWLDYSFPRVLGRLLYRTLRRIFAGEKIYSDNTESFYRTFFTTDSILVWMIKSYPRRRRTYRALLANPPEGVEMLAFRHPSEADAFLARTSRADGVLGSAGPADTRAGRRTE